MKSFFAFFIKRHLLANLLTIIILLMGLFSLYRINRSELPKIDIGEVIISTFYPGASPEDVELNVTNKIEDEIKNITGIKQIVSASFENSSIVNIEIDIDSADEEKVKTEIREAVAREPHASPGGPEQSVAIQGQRGFGRDGRDLSSVDGPDPVGPGRGLPRHAGRIPVAHGPVCVVSQW